MNYLPSENEYTIRDNEDKKKLAQQLSDVSGYDFKFISRYCESVSGNMVEDHGEIGALVDGVMIYANHHEYHTEFSFYTDYRKLPYIEYEDSKNFNDLPTPNKVHKINGRAIQKWVKYLVEQYIYLAQLSNERQKKVNQYKNTISLLAKLSDHVYQSKDGNNGELEKNGLRFMYAIHSNAYISEEVKIMYEFNNLDGFIKLSKINK